MDILNKIGDAVSYFFVDYTLSFLPTREQVAVEFVNWQRDRLNSWISQVCIFILIIPFSMFLNWGFVHEYSGGGVMGMIYSIISHTFLIIPAIRGYSKLKARILEKIQSRDPVKMIENFIAWWGQPSDPILRNIILISIPFIYVFLFNYQEWIGYQIGGFIVYRTLRIFMQIMFLSYSNMIFELVSSIWSTREINKIVDQFDSQIPPPLHQNNSSPNRMDESFVMIDPEPVPKPKSEPVLEPVLEAVVPEPVLEPVVPEPVVEPIPEPVIEPIQKLVIVSASEPIGESNVNLVDNQVNQMIDSVGIESVCQSPNMSVNQASVVLSIQNDQNPVMEPYLENVSNRIQLQNQNRIEKPEIGSSNGVMGNSLLFQSAVMVDASAHTPLQEVRSGGSIKDRLKSFEKFHSGN
jgi:hypothetical protein